jgi:hypothetical protein
MMKGRARKFLLVIFLITLAIFIFLCSKERTSSKEIMSEAVILGPPNISFNFHAVGTSGREWQISTATYDKPLHVLKLTSEDFVSCELERVSGNGVLTLEIFHKTNLVDSVELPADKRMIKLQKNRWSHEIF